MADAVNACFESKYHYNFWRPISAIQLADTDGNAATGRPELDAGCADAQPSGVPGRAWLRHRLR